MIINSKSVKEIYAFLRYENVIKKRFIEIIEDAGKSQGRKTTTDLSQVDKEDITIAISTTS